MTLSHCKSQGENFQYFTSKYIVCRSLIDILHYVKEIAFILGILKDFIIKLFWIFAQTKHRYIITKATSWIYLDTTVTIITCEF